MERTASTVPYWLPLFVVGMWLAVGGLLSTLSGWPFLAKRCPGGPRPSGAVLRRQVVGIGFVSENGVTHMVVSEGGLYLWATPIFRFLRPPILVPWAQVAYVSENRFLWSHSHLLRLGGITSIRIKDRAYQALRTYLTETDAV
jgi:hypothetical protein